MYRRRTFATTMVAFGLGLAVIPGCEQVAGLTDNKTLVLRDARTGALVVRISGDFSSLRSTQAKIADIDHVTVGLEMSGIDSKSRTITKAELANGGSSASATFEALPPGNATVSIGVFDLSNAAIGAATASATILASQTTALNIGVELAPTYVYSGSLTTNITITDGPTIHVSPSPSPSLSPAPSLTQSANVSTFAGNGEAAFANGTGTSAKLYYPRDLAFDQSGNLLVADSENRCIRKITPNGEVSTFAESTTYGFVDGPAATAKFINPTGLAFDQAGNLFVVDAGNRRIRKITPSGVVSTFAGSGETAFADGIGTSASFKSLSGLAIDKTGNLFVCDEYRIRRITPSGVVSTFAGSGTYGSSDGPVTSATFYYPSALAFDQAGNLFVADSSNHRIRKITPTGEVSTFAGSSEGFADGMRASAAFKYPYGLAFDQSGNLFVADGINHRIRKVSPDGAVTTIAGSGTGAYADGTGISARFWSPYGLAFDQLGNLFVADGSNHRIRKIQP